MLDGRFASLGFPAPGIGPGHGDEALLPQPEGSALSAVPAALPDAPIPANRWVASLKPIVGRVIGLGSALPVPAVLKRHVSRREAAFIAAAYAIPLPGTALVAALLVGARLLYRRLRSRWADRSLILAGNG